MQTLKIYIVGAQSTGKTTISKFLADHFDTTWIPEYAREFYTNNLKDFEYNDVEILISKQIQLELDAIKTVNKLLICDTDILTTLVWSDIFFKKVPTIAVKHLKPFPPNYYILLANDIEFIDDPQRSHEHLRVAFYNKFLFYFNKFGLKYGVVSGKGDERFANAIALIESCYTEYLRGQDYYNS